MVDGETQFGEPQNRSVEYPHNLIRLALCELRFPDLVELEKGFQPRVQAALRRNYPRAEPALEVGGATIGPAGAVSLGLAGRISLDRETSTGR